MTENNREAQYLIHLLSCAINEKQAEYWDGIDYSRLLKLSFKHQVFSTVYSVLSEVDGVPSEHMQEFRNYYMNYVQQTLMLSGERNAIFDELTENKIRYMPLKGSILKGYYPKEIMRQMGDIDVLYDTNYRDTVARIMSERGYKNFSSGENSDDYEKEPKLVFEFHRTLFFEESNFNPRFDNLWEPATPDDDNEFLYHMDINNLYLHSVCHMYKHYNFGGCGIRFLADTYLMLKAENDNLDWQWIDKKLDEYGIKEFERETKELAFAMFEEKELNEAQKALLDIFLTFGIFGTQDNAVKAKLSSLANGNEIDSKVLTKYKLYRLFPPKKKMIADYRVLEKHRYLLPAMYVYRLIKATFNFKKTKQEIEMINNSKN